MSSKKIVFVGLMQEHKAIIYKISRTYCDDKNLREDLAQEIVFNLWESFDSFKPDFKFSTWMYRIALNVAISFYRKGSKQPDHVPIDEDLILADDVHANNEETEMNIRLLEKFIGELDEIDKSIMLLYLDDKSYREIAGITGLSETNVATKIGRIKIKLKSNFATIQKN